MKKTPLLSLDNEQRRSVADICIAGAQLSAGSIVIPFILGVDQTTTSVLIFGLSLTILFCILSILIVKRKVSKK